MFTLLPAKLTVIHRRQGEYVTPPLVYTNFITLPGRDFLHEQTYGTAPAANGLNYIAVSSDPVTENASSTSLTGEIVGSGLSRTQGAVTHASNTQVTRIEHTFTASAVVVAQKAALFNLAVGGTMNHVVAFTPRNLEIGDTLTLIFEVTVT